MSYQTPQRAWLYATQRTAPSTTTAPSGDRTAASGNDQASEATPAATVSFSSAAQDISNAKAAIDNVPAGREQLVNSLKQQVEAGTYNVSSTDIADMMLRRASADSVS